MTDEAQETLGSLMFSVKFSASDPRDMQLLEWIRSDTRTRTVNVSGVIKDLLYAWYELRLQLRRLPIPKIIDLHERPSLPPGNGNGHHPEWYMPDIDHEDPDDELVRRMAGISFEEI